MLLAHKHQLHHRTSHHESLRLPGNAVKKRHQTELRALLSAWSSKLFNMGATPAHEWTANHCSEQLRPFTKPLSHPSEVGFFFKSVALSNQYFEFLFFLFACLCLFLHLMATLGAPAGNRVGMETWRQSRRYAVFPAVAKGTEKNKTKIKTK